MMPLNRISKISPICISNIYSQKPIC